MSTTEGFSDPQPETNDRDAIRAEAFAEAEQALRDMANTWGGDLTWVTTGTRVADVAASVIRDLAREDLGR